MIDERTDWFISRYSVEPYLLPRLKELKIDDVAFVTEFWKHHKKETHIGLAFIRWGFKYNYLFNERLERSLDHPTWRMFIIDCLTKPMEENKIEIDRGLWPKNNPGIPLPKHLEYSHGRYPK